MTTTHNHNSPLPRNASTTPPGDEPRPNAKPPPGHVPLPAVPKTKSPVPWLSSIHATPGRGQYGDARYRGNCSGLLIRDLLLYHRPRRVLDPMTGGGTCRDVCRELGVECVSKDIRAGFDAADPTAYSALGEFDFVWVHPPDQEAQCHCLQG